MNIKSFRKILLGLVSVAVVFMLLTFYMYFSTRGGTWVAELPGDYQVLRLHGNSVVIRRANNGLQVIGSPVDGYAVRGCVVVGHVGKPAAGEVSDYGYFVINTHQHIVRKKLSKKTYMRLLSQYGISGEPVLKM